MTKKLKEITKRDAKSAKFNAVKSGRWSTHIVIEEGDREMLKSIVKRLQKEWMPQGESERELVRTVGYLMLRKQNLFSHYAQARLEMKATLDDDYNASNAIGEIREELNHIVGVTAEIEKVRRNLIQLKASKDTLQRLGAGSFQEPQRQLAAYPKTDRSARFLEANADEKSIVLNN